MWCTINVSALPILSSSFLIATIKQLSKRFDITYVYDAKSYYDKGKMF